MQIVIIEKKKKLRQFYLFIYLFIYLFYEKISHAQKTQKIQNANKQLSLRCFLYAQKAQKHKKHKT